MKLRFRFDGWQLLRLLVMVVAVAAALYALEYLPASPQMWISVGVLLFGFMVMLFVFRIAARRRKNAAPRRTAASGRRLNKG